MMGNIFYNGLWAGHINRDLFEQLRAARERSQNVTISNINTYIANGNIYSFEPDPDPVQETALI